MALVKKYDLGLQGCFWICAYFPGEQVQSFHWFKAGANCPIITKVMDFRRFRQYNGIVPPTIGFNRPLQTSISNIDSNKDFIGITNRYYYKDIQQEPYSYLYYL